MKFQSIEGKRALGFGLLVAGLIKIVLTLALKVEPDFAITSFTVLGMIIGLYLIYITKK
jgi:hypothetical protein